MTTGRVNTVREPVIGVRFRRPDGSTREVDAVVDTGFNDELVVPDWLAADIGTMSPRSTRAFLADGSEQIQDRTFVELWWNGQYRRIEALMMGPTVLVGMKLLDGHTLFIAGGPGGVVEVRPVP